MNVDVDDMNEEELDALLLKVAARREDLTKKMDPKGMSGLIESLLGDATPTDYDFPEAGNWVGTNMLPAALISLRKGASGFIAKTHRGDTFAVVVEEITEPDNLDLIERATDDK